MLVISRKLGEAIRLGDDIVITVVEMGIGRVRLGIEAPRSCKIFRQELLEQPQVGSTTSPPQQSSQGENSTKEVTN